MATQQQRTDKFLSEAKAKFGDKFDYSCVNYKNTATHVDIICPVHGKFSQSPSDHLRSDKGCGRCSVSYLEDFVECANSEDSNITNEIIYLNDKKKIQLTCKLHGQSLVSVDRFRDGTRCKGCERQKRFEEFLKRAKEIHGDKYDYSLVEYKTQATQVKIICPIHGIFKQTPNLHVNRSYGCRKCGHRKSRDEVIEKNSKLFESKAKNVHGNKYSYEKVDYIHSKRPVEIYCNSHGGYFFQRPNDHLLGKGCSYCNKIYSSLEHFIRKYLEESHIKFVERDRTIISPYELDFYLPDHKLAIECNGLYWHSELQGKDNNYHLNKTNLCNDAGIQLIHIFQDEILERPKAVLKLIDNVLNLNIIQTKFKIGEVDKKKKDKFLNINHIKGSDVSNISIGMSVDGELIDVMCFNEIQDKHYHITRTAINCQNNYKLLNYFEKNYTSKSLILHADIRFGHMDEFKSLGFHYFEQLSPKYYWLNSQNSHNNKRYEQDFRDNLDSNDGWYKIWDCGALVFRKLYAKT